MLVRPLVRELLLVLGLKVLALALIFALFFSPAHRPRTDAEAMSRALLSEPAAEPAP